MRFWAVCMGGVFKRDVELSLLWTDAGLLKTGCGIVVVVDRCEAIDIYIYCVEA
jgi:hypothetical protein